MPAEILADPPEDEGPANATLTELLLWRLGIPADRERILDTRQKKQIAVDLAPPLTASKLMSAIAQVPIALINEELTAAQANALLYSLQTMLSAIRVQITEEKWKLKKTASSKRRKKKTSRSRRKSG